MNISPYLYIGYQCNNNCVFCSEADEYLEKLKPKNFRDIKKEILKVKTKYNSVTFMGREPILRKDIFDILRFAVSLSFEKVSLATNGRMLSYRSFARKILKIGVNHIGVSLSGATPKTHDRLTQVPGSFEQTIKGIENISKFRKDGVSLLVNLPLNRENYFELKDMIDLVVNLGVREINILFTAPLSKRSRTKKIVMKMRELGRYVMDTIKPYLNNPNLKFLLVEYLPCSLPQESRKYFFPCLEENPDKVRIPLCDDCGYKDKCDGVLQSYIDLYGIEEFMLRNDTPSTILKNINPQNGLMGIFKDKDLEMVHHQKERRPKILYINLDERCNQNCVFCVVKGSNIGKFGSMNTEEAKRITKKFVEYGGKNLVFTGGEPTLRDDLPEIIGYAEQFNGLKSISIITNGVRLSDKPYFEKILKADKKNIVTFSVSLHSHKKNISELLTRTKNTFKRTMSGIENAIQKGKKVSIYNVITSKNYKDILDFCEFLNKNYPKINNITFAYPFPQGNALFNKWIYVKLSQLKPYLLKGLNFLEKRNYEISIAACGQFPLCVTPRFEEKIIRPVLDSEENISGVVGDKTFHDFDMASEEWINQYKGKPEECSDCILNRYCQGFWKEYINLFSFDGLGKITKDNFQGNKIKCILKSRIQLQSAIKKIFKRKMNLFIIKDYTDNYLERLIDFLKTKDMLAVILYKDNILYPKDCINNKV